MTIYCYQTNLILVFFLFNALNGYICFRVYHYHNKPVITIDSGIWIRGLKRKIAYEEIENMSATSTLHRRPAQEILIIRFKPTTNVAEIKGEKYRFLPWPPHFRWKGNELIIVSNELNMSAKHLLEYIRADQAHI